ncbi:MAG: 4Fe-4S binding protein [Firmicutes bacterium]|nr:4Fe-4S binding protein [Bacillota bacterium]
MEDIYIKLREKLDGLSFGYPKTENGEELEILKWFFDPEDAELFIEMEDRFQTPAEVASQTGRDPVLVANRLEVMAQKGLVFRRKDDDETQYRILPMVHGIYEANDKRINLDPAFGRKFAKYFGKYMMKAWNSTDTPLFRTIPIDNELVSGSEVLPYDDAAAIIKSKKKIALTDCACRGLMESIGKRTCNHPIETCLMFDEVADYYVKNGNARYVSTEETLGFLKRNEEAGLVINVANSVNPEVMCSCCSCCCGVNVAVKYFEGPSRTYQSNYKCQKDEDLCIGCGACVERCAFGANKMIDEKQVFKKERCYGCGLCVTTCPAGARSLARKPEGELYAPPNSLYSAYNGMKRYRRENPSS